MACSHVTVNENMFLGAATPIPIRSESALSAAGERFPADLQKKIQVELDRLLSSREFRGSKALSDLLRYCVGHTLTQTPQQLREYWIGVNVFHRGEEFDPAADPIVRVQARRLRHKLEAHYRASTQELRISLRKGVYLADFHFATVEPLSGPPPAAGIGSVAVLPILDLNADSDNRSFCDGLMDELIHSLADGGDLLVVARTSLLQYRNTLIDVRDIGHQLGADAIIEGSVLREASRRRVSMRLIDARTGYALRSWQADSLTGDELAVQENLAQNFAANIKQLVAEKRSGLVAR